MICLNCNDHEEKEVVCCVCFDTYKLALDQSRAQVEQLEQSLANANEKNQEKLSKIEKVTHPKCPYCESIYTGELKKEVLCLYCNTKFKLRKLKLEVKGADE